MINPPIRWYEWCPRHCSWTCSCPSVTTDLGWDHDTMLDLVWMRLVFKPVETVPTNGLL